MPITRKQFELGIDLDVEQVMEALSGFLMDHPEEAYTSGELWDRFRESSAFQSLWENYVSHRALSEIAEGLMRQLFEDNEARQIFDYGLQVLVDRAVVFERAVRAVHYYSVGPRSLDEVLNAGF